MPSWHDRLQHALDVRGKAWTDLVPVTGLTLPSVRAWHPQAAKRTTMMNGDNAARVCAFLMINPLWLFDNVGPSGLEMGEGRFQPTSEEIDTITHLRSLPEEDARAVMRIITRLATHRNRAAVE